MPSGPERAKNNSALILWKNKLETYIKINYSNYNLNTRTANSRITKKVIIF
jgi:hypothetical protein